ncbi:MAG: hypothetical protein COB67_03690 [SAR324 cluster bacterium]|uniref:Prepilin-type N-terminal cleavage/methylation domain-containing protein n=1 Tax=SAR324 cluster bacterium TaxID=2024889 RepID=A0A2A4T7S7_9DELT|nr:MAG: hypothetical protein COB67_03690 [SAR324 cluster bacterium]
MANAQLPAGKPGFTLLEVLVSFALLSLLLTVLIQSQSNAIFFLEKTQKLERVQKEVANKLLTIERSSTPVEASNGTFQEEHPLAGDQWQLTKEIKSINGLLPMEEVKYRIIWQQNKHTQSFESSILR